MFVNEKKYTLALLLLILSGCSLPQHKVEVYSEPENGDVAKLRVVGFTEHTIVETNRTCNIKDLRSGYLRDTNNKEQFKPIKDRGFKKSNLPADGFPLDYYEILISASNFTNVMSTFYVTPAVSCSVQTGLFKPQKGELYEMRNRVDLDGKTCTSQLHLIDQTTGKATPVKTIRNQTINSALNCNN